MLIPKLVQFMLLTVKQCKIDESHSLSHGMNVLHFAHRILESELPSHLYLERQRNIIYTSALVHDMCDTKYVNEDCGIMNLDTFLTKETTLTKNEIQVATDIIQSMSYSKVKKNGYPDLGAYQLAYHIVREADLLAAYDFDRSLIYNMNNVNPEFDVSYQNALELFKNRVFRHNDDHLFITEYSKQLSKQLEEKSKVRIQIWNECLGKK
jgi:HD superfamily phosphodiesterase